jgi:nucleoside-diphosphate-sugar epimerase
MASTSKAAVGPILITGGAGFIGSHTIVCLLEQGYNVVVVDNLVNSNLVALDRVAELVNLDDAARKERLVFHNVDICDRDALKRVFETSPKFHACIHFAGLKVNTIKINMIRAGSSSDLIRFICVVQSNLYDLINFLTINNV